MVSYRLFWNDRAYTATWSLVIAFGTVDVMKLSGFLEALLLFAFLVTLIANYLSGAMKGDIMVYTDARLIRYP